MKEKVISLKFVDKDGTAVDFVMVEGEDMNQAFSIATKWAEMENRRPYEKIEMHQGVMNAPELDEDVSIDGFRIWNLPF